MHAAVTGGAGFIGHHVVAGLCARGERVNVLDDLSTGREARLRELGHSVAVTRGSVLDPAALDRALAGSDVVFHHAAIASVARSLVEPRVVNEVNTAGTIEVVLAAARQGVRRVVFASSSAVYGSPVELPCREGQPLEPQSPYGASKLAAEHHLHALGRHLGVETVALRYFNVYGPGQDPDAEYAAVIPRFIAAALQERPPTINGSGEISRDFIYVDDVVEATVLAADPRVPSGLTCNVASGARTSLLDLVEVIGRAAGQALTPTFGPPRAGDVEHSVADVALAASILGFRAAVDLAEGVQHTFEWYRARGG